MSFDASKLKYQIMDGGAAVERFALDDSFEEYVIERSILPAQIILLEGDIKLHQLLSEAWLELGQFLIIDGNLQVDAAIKFKGEEGGLWGMLVTGDVSAQSMTMEDVHITVAGNLTLAQYLHTPRPDYESGRLYVKGVTAIPYIVQEDLNPELTIPRYETRYWYTPEESDIALHRDFFRQGSIEDIAAVVAYMEQRYQGVAD